MLGVADLFDEEAGVVGEYDGADHRSGGRHTRDVAREDRFRRAGLEYFKVTGGDAHDHEAMAERMLETRSRARFARPSERAWTLRIPDFWEIKESLDDRFAYAEWLAAEIQRERTHGAPSTTGF